MTSKSTTGCFQVGESSPKIPAMNAVASYSTTSIDGCLQNHGDGGGDEPPDAAVNDDQDLSTLDFSGAFQELDFNRWYRITWTTILAIAGLLDILASASPFFRAHDRCTGLLATKELRTTPNVAPRGSSMGLRFQGIEFCHVVWTPFLLWLERHDVAIAFLFSLLWFRVAFSRANEVRNAAVITEDRSRLLEMGDMETNDCRRVNHKKAGPNHLYYRRIFTEMVLLPVGFYIILCHFGRDIVSHTWPLLGASEKSSDVADEINVVAFADQDDRVEYELFTERSKTSVLSAIIQHVYRSVLAATIVTRAEITEYLKKSAIPLLARRLLRNAIRNPLKFKRQLRSLLVYLRWIKYMAPLIGTFNKLNGNVQDMLVKRRQERIAKKQRRVQRILWGKKSKRDKQEDAAITLQRAYRAHLARKRTRVLLRFNKAKKTLAATRIQAVLRRKLSEARLRLLKKRKELYRLEKQRRQSPHDLSEKDRKRLYELQDEFTAEATKTINRRLLMRPNTKFAVAWKLLFIICIGIEIAEQAATPWLVRQNATKKKNDNEAMSMRELIAMIFVPKATADLQKCEKPRTSLLQKIVFGGRKKGYRDSNRIAVLSRDSHWICREPFSTWRDHLRDVLALAMIPFPVSEWTECRAWKPESLVDRLTFRFRKHDIPVAWYCSEPYASFHKYYRRFIDFWIDEFKTMISVICFLDVFVTIFTGEIDADTGELVPKPFLQRWIFPGFVMQILVNPSLGPVSSIVSDACRTIIQVGPVRVFRWFIAFGIPLLYGVVRLVIWIVNESFEETEKLLVSYIVEQTELNIFILL